MRRILVTLPLAVMAVACGSGDSEPTAVAPSSPSTATSTMSTMSATSTTASPPTTPTTPTTVVPVSTAAPITTSVTAAPPTSPPGTDTPESSGLIGRELLGNWAHYDVVAYEDGDLKTLIISYGFNEFTEVDGRIVDAARFCFSEQRTDQPIETSLSDAATQAIKPPATPIEVVDDNGRLVIRRSATPTPVGIRLDDPVNESLPTDPNDPRIVDDDGDGKPGITVTIEVTDELSGELYIARREIFAYEATLVDPDRLEGVVTDDSEQLVIGASDPIFATSGADWRQYPDLTKSPIILQRVDGTWDCDRLADERDQLFPPTPDVDW